MFNIFRAELDKWKLCLLGNPAAVSLPLVGCILYDGWTIASPISWPVEQSTCRRACVKCLHDSPSAIPKDNRMLGFTSRRVSYHAFLICLLMCKPFWSQWHLFSGFLATSISSWILVKNVSICFKCFPQSLFYLFPHQTQIFAFGWLFGAKNVAITSRNTM